MYMKINHRAPQQRREGREEKKILFDPNFRKVAIQAVKKAGEILKKNFRKEINVRYKKDLTPLTDIDLRANEAIVGLIKKNFPSFNILSEESGGNYGKEFTWVIDPLDGTRNYIMGFPFFSVALALLRKKEPILSVVFNPISRELYLAEKGKGAYLNRHKIKVNRINNLSKVVLHFNKGKGADLESELKTLIKIAPYIRTIRYYGSSDLDICSVASGKVEGYLVNKPHYSDIIPGALIVKEAGGKVTDFDGKDWQIDTNNALITNGKIHNQILKLIKTK